MAIAYDPSVERLLKECEEGMDDQPKPEEKSQRWQRWHTALFFNTKAWFVWN